MKRGSRVDVALAGVPPLIPVPDLSRQTLEQAEMNPNDKSVPPPLPIWVPGIALLSGAIGAACTRLWKHVRPRTKLATLPSIRGHLDAGRQQITADRLVRCGLRVSLRSGAAAAVLEMCVPRVASSSKEGA